VTEERLQRVLAARGAGSRRHAETLIRAGRVTVGGQVITELGTKIPSDHPDVRVDGKKLRPQPFRYILLNKPSGYITTTSDERGRRTVMELVRVNERMYPVGRLDRDTQGLLLLTNDGDLADRVMHPRYELAKEYHVLTPKRPMEHQLQQIRDGITLDGRTTAPDECRILRETRDGWLLKIVIHEGRYHVVRRMMDAVAIPVAALNRERLGPLSVSGIAPGSWRELSPGERSTLFEALHLDRVSSDRRPPRHPSGTVSGVPSPPYRPPGIPRSQRVNKGSQPAPVHPSSNRPPHEGRDSGSTRVQPALDRHRSGPKQYRQGQSTAAQVMDRRHATPKSSHGRVQQPTIDAASGPPTSSAVHGGRRAGKRSANGHASSKNTNQPRKERHPDRGDVDSGRRTNRSRSPNRPPRSPMARTERGDRDRHNGNHPIERRSDDDRTKHARGRSRVPTRMQTDSSLDDRRNPRDDDQKSPSSDSRLDSTKSFKRGRRRHSAA
jgi:23S rRNA pseudouridine2605 synthase